MSELEESSKAVAETAKFGAASVEAVEKFGGFLAKILGEPITDAVGIFGDKLKFIRLKNKLIIMDKVNRILDERCVVNTRQIPPKFAIPIMEYATLEEDESLQDIWCKLIANSLDPNFDKEIRCAFIDIIRNLTPLDAKILDFVYHGAFRKVVSVNQEFTRMYMSKIVVNLENICKQLNVHEEELTISYHNLMRVECLRYIGQQSSIAVGEDETVPLMINDPMRVAITPLGIAFVEACIETSQLEDGD